MTISGKGRFFPGNHINELQGRAEFRCQTVFFVPVCLVHRRICFSGCFSSFLVKTIKTNPGTGSFHWKVQIFPPAISLTWNFARNPHPPRMKKNHGLVSFWWFFINNLFYLINHRYKASYIITIHTQKSHKNIILRKCSLKLFNFSIIIMIRMALLFTRFWTLIFLLISSCSFSGTKWFVWKAFLRRNASKTYILFGKVQISSEIQSLTDFFAQIIKVP